MWGADNATSATAGFLHLPQRQLGLGTVRVGFRASWTVSLIQSGNYDVDLTKALRCGGVLHAGGIQMGTLYPKGLSRTMTLSVQGSLQGCFQTAQGMGFLPSFVKGKAPSQNALTSHTPPSTALA